MLSCIKKIEQPVSVTEIQCNSLTRYIMYIVQLCFPTSVYVYEVDNITSFNIQSIMQSSTQQNTTNYNLKYDDRVFAVFITKQIPIQCTGFPFLSVNVFFQMIQPKTFIQVIKASL